jgi:alanyl-tRNA synthetase
VGYTELAAEAKVVALLKEDSPVESAGADSDVGVVLDITPFYAEAGGQVGDKGVLQAKGLKAEVVDTREPVKGLTVHRIHIAEGEIRVGQLVVAQVEENIRRDTAAHHSATHLLQSALRKVLGDHVYQTGSLVTPYRFRFDYAHFSAPDARQLHRVEALVNQHIRENIPVQSETLPFEEAKQRGAIALFGEKYGDQVRTVAMSDVSMELCGGTHVHATGDIGLCVITSESSVAAGVRRIEAVCGSAAYHRVREGETIIDETAASLNVQREEVCARIEQLLEEKKRLEKDLTRLKSAIVADKVDTMLSAAVDVDGIKVLAVRIDDHDANSLRKTADSLKAKLKSGVVVLGGVSGNKVLLIAGVTKDLTGRLHAGNLLKHVAKIVDGGGGGRPDMAQAGGKDPSKIQAALEEVPRAVRRMLKGG